MLELQDAITLLVLHSVNFGRYSAAVGAKLVAQLNRADADLFGRLAVLLEDAPAGLTDQAAYLTSMLESVRGLNAQAYAAVQTSAQAEVLATAALEVAFNGRLYGAAAGQVPLAAVGADTVYAAAMSRPFQGRLLKEAFRELGEARHRRMRDVIRTGFVSGKTAQDIVRELRGTKAKGYQEGFVQLDRTHLDTVVHSALSHTAATAREQFFEENKKVIASQVWLSTLDSRTSEVCIARSGKRYTTGGQPKPIGHAVPWCAPHGCGPGRAHYRCRSVAIALLPGQEKLLGQRSSIDGPVDANLSYQDWLSRQTDYTQNEVLGVKRAQLFRDGGLKLDRFADEKGRWLTLEEIKKKDAEAFKRAGL